MAVWFELGSGGNQEKVAPEGKKTFLTLQKKGLTIDYCVCFAAKQISRIFVVFFFFRNHDGYDKWKQKFTLKKKTCQHPTP